VQGRDESREIPDASSSNPVPGFSPDPQCFLRELERNNAKAWFDRRSDP